MDSDNCVEPDEDNMIREITVDDDPFVETWLSVKQLIVYHTVLHVHRIVKCGSPLYLSDRLVSNYFYRTRQAAGGGVCWLGENAGELSLFFYWGRQQLCTTVSQQRSDRVHNFPCSKIS